MEPLILISTTGSDRGKLQELAAYLVDHQLAACCQIGGPITSWYRWQGQTESADEWVCTIKTLKRKFSDVRDAILNLHPYDQPQIVAIDIADASEGYQKWVLDSIEPT